MNPLHVTVANENAVIRRTDDIDQKLRERHEKLSPYLQCISRMLDHTQACTADHVTLHRLFILLEMTELDKLRSAELVSDWHRSTKDADLEDSVTE